MLIFVVNMTGFRITFKDTALCVCEGIDKKNKLKRRDPPSIQAAPSQAWMDKKEEMNRSD